MAGKKPRKKPPRDGEPKVKEGRTARAAEGKEPPARPAVNLGRLGSTMKPKQRKYMLEPWVLERNLTLVTGRANTGKSTFGAYLMAMAGRSVMLPGLEETTDDSLPGRWEANGVDPDSVLILDDATYTFPEHKGRIADVVMAHRAKLLWIDPVDSYKGDINPNHPDPVRAYLESLAWIGQKTGAAVVGVRHPGKRADNVLPGAHTWRDTPRVVMEMVYDQGPPESWMAVAEKHSYGRLGECWSYDLVGGKDEPKVLVWGQKIDKSRADSVRGLDDQIDRWKVDQAEQFLKAVLADGPKESAWIYKQGDMERLNDRILRRAAKRLGVVVDRKGNGKDHKSEWVLPG